MAWLPHQLRWLMGLLLPLLACAVTFTPGVGQILPGFMFLLAVTITTVLAGFGPGLLATALSTVGLALLIPFHAAQRVNEPGRWLAVVMFAACCTAVVLWLHGLVRSELQHRFKALERESEQLRETAQLNHRLLASQRIARMAGFEVDAATRRSTWSEELCRLMGRTDHPPNETAVLAHIHPDDLPKIQEFQDQILVHGQSASTEARMVRVDGTIREMLLHGEPVRSGLEGDGEVVGLWGVLQDVTEVRVAQRAAAEASEQQEAEHRLLELFQRAMLPAELPAVPKTGLAATYLSVADRIDIGGDWYDAFQLTDGRLALSVGDVVGHDQQAAAIMGQLRVTARGYKVENPDPGTVLTRLNRLLAMAYPPGTLVSAVIGLYEPETGHFHWANAGHPHPLLATIAPTGPPPSGTDPPVPRTTVQVLTTTDPILGAVGDHTYRTRTVTVPPDSALLCYTDGLVERRRTSLDSSLAELATVFEQLATQALTGDIAGMARGKPPGHLQRPGCTDPRATAIVDGLTAELAGAGSPPEDDVCLLVLRR